MSLKKVVEQIRRNNTFLITAHISLEADALGSELALLYLLKKLKKKAFIINESRVPPECKFLPGIDEVRPFSKVVEKFDCAVFLDCSDNSRAGGVANLVNNDSVTLNIDHHISNTYFASVNWVEPAASCACELIYRLYKSFKMPIDKNIATMLYAGIVTDTGSFRFRNTSSLTHIIAASLISKGACVRGVYNALYEANTFNNIKLLGAILSTINRDPAGKIAWAQIFPRGRGEIIPYQDLSESVLSALRSIKGVELAIVFKKVKGKKDTTRVNFRSQNDFDCNMLASRFGGGGHKNASGATVRGDFSNIKNRIINYARKLMASAR